MCDSKVHFHAKRMKIILKFYLISHLGYTGVGIFGPCQVQKCFPACTKGADSDHPVHVQSIILGPVVQSVVSLTSSLRVILLTVLVDSIYNILIFFAEKM